MKYHIVFAIILATLPAAGASAGQSVLYQNADGIKAPTQPDRTITAPAQLPTLNYQVVPMTGEEMDGLDRVLEAFQDTSLPKAVITRADVCAEIIIKQAHRDCTTPDTATPKETDGMMSVMRSLDLTEIARLNQ